MAFKPQGLHILFVDDDSALLQVASQMLTRLGHSVRGESGSLKALKVFSEAPNDFDIAILDVTMADITGLELAQRFRRIQPGFPIILYGGDIDSATIDEADEAGVFHFNKPATSREFAAALAGALKR